jgi:prolyl 4-hydroxylase
MDTFIAQEFIPSEICENLMVLFQNSNKKREGTVWHGDVDGVVNPQEKNSLECHYNIYDNKLSDYCRELQNVLIKYIKTYPYANSYSAFTIKEPVKIQYYKPNQGYAKYHTERGSCQPVNSARHLVFMTYLNTVNDGGGTEFFHQNTTTAAVQGKTLIWPADWTHTHRGIVSPTQEKYIITGWYSFI